MSTNRYLLVTLQSHFGEITRFYNPEVEFVNATPKELARRLKTTLRDLSKGRFAIRYAFLRELRVEPWGSRAFDGEFEPSEGTLCITETDPIAEWLEEKLPKEPGKVHGIGFQPRSALNDAGVGLVQVYML